MDSRAPFRLTTVALAVLTLTLLVFSVLNFQQRLVYQLPDDGVSWVDSREGIVAWMVAKDGPGARAGIREHDVLRSMDGRPMDNAGEAARVIFQAGVWSRVTYELSRQGERFETAVVISPQKSSESLRYYLFLVGALYLFIGAFILIRRWTAPKSLHFYFFCLASFVLYTFSYSGKLNLFDWTIYWLNVAALSLQPALFVHFCLDFPVRRPFLRQRFYLIPLLYVPGLLLLATHVLVALGVLMLPLPLLHARWLLDRIGLIYLAAYFLAGAIGLQYAYRRAQGPLRKQQLKWVTRGTFLAIVPFAALYALPYFLGFIPAPWMKLSALSLIFLPLTFGYAIVRYRLMDVDIIFRRGIAYTLATATIVALSFGLIVLFADFFRAQVPLPSRWSWILAIIITAFLFQPIVNWIQVRLDRFFSRERYDYRRILLAFARELTSELHVERLLDQVAERLAETLGVDRLAVFLATDSHGFKLVKSRGLSRIGTLDLSFLDPGQPELQKGYLFFDSVKRPFGLELAVQATIEELDLHYYLPFRFKERTLGYLGLGKTREGGYLSSEDVDLLQTIAGYVSVALENAQLYESLEHKALEYETLKDFNENIIESIHAGVIAFDPEQRIETWNSGMEKLYGLPRTEVVGKKLGAFFPADLLAELPQLSEPGRTLSLYKFRLTTPDGRERIVNLSTGPLVGKGAEVIGRLLIIHDLTERVNLEDQLMQAEKLSSIGLLAAGVAHEVNTPLAVIASQAQMLLRQVPPDNPQAATLEKIVKQAFRASEIVNHLLKFSRVSGSEHAELDLNKVIRETVALLDPMLRAAKISLNVQLEPSLPPVSGNYGKLQQVFMNLIMNAHDAMPHGGEIILATEAENSTVSVEVTDHGVGIPPEQLSKIYDPFFTTKASSRGTGLGLSVTYGIIREHSGKIQVASTVGQGTSFRLEFPAVRKPVNVS
jgi:PAS domain S-box-containing protein